MLNSTLFSASAPNGRQQQWTQRGANWVLQIITINALLNNLLEKHKCEQIVIKLWMKIEKQVKEIIIIIISFPFFSAGVLPSFQKLLSYSHSFTHSSKKSDLSQTHSHCGLLAWLYEHTQYMNWSKMWLGILPLNLFHFRPYSFLFRRKYKICVAKKWAMKEVQKNYFSKHRVWRREQSEAKARKCFPLEEKNFSQNI